jgi:hypothetical protein
VREEGQCGAGRSAGRHARAAGDDLHGQRRREGAAGAAPGLTAIRQWEFAPGTLNGQPVNVQFNLTVSFHVN